jgi:hypothetical protein
LIKESAEIKPDSIPFRGVAVAGSRTDSTKNHRPGSADARQTVGAPADVQRISRPKPRTIEAVDYEAPEFRIKAGLTRHIAQLEVEVEQARRTPDHHRTKKAGK